MKKSIIISSLVLIVVSVVSGMIYYFMSEIQLLRSENSQAINELRLEQDQVLEESRKENEELRLGLSEQSEQLNIANNSIIELSEQVNTRTTSQAEVEGGSVNNDQYSIQEIITLYEAIIGQIACVFEYTDGTSAQMLGSGSLIIYPDGRRSVLTNRHVVTDEYGNGPSQCYVKFPNNSSIYTGSNLTKIGSGIQDAVYLDLENIDQQLLNMAVGMRKYCEHKPSLGDQIFILGYPSVGSTESITVTEGIISGFETNYLVTSAKIEQGNSGGAAIDANKACYWGIPTYARSGYVESLARILKWDSF